ncbi:serine hydrolase [Saccharibacillus sp. O23]|uniref:serine hydrolase domain-containing protein n=1 Tax=Saccharibacillus sp. O23 TaxID=2009338 RepID=UPI000B4E1D90|nr:serine hydrolase domain-containing protein [Saccharibacillus sp. O23]OWR30434.1 serine hydrolase [Saccharibacillus sp. O23]
MKWSQKTKIALTGLLLGASIAAPGSSVASAAPAASLSVEPQGIVNPSAGAAAPYDESAEETVIESTPVVSAAWKPEQIDAYAEAAMKRLHIPGLAVGIVQNGEIAYMQGYGTAGPGAGPMTPQTPLAIGSTSKSLTALAVMQLVEEGKIKLDAPVTDYLPDFRLADAAQSARITVKQLLNQTSGLSTYDGVAFLSRGDGTLMQHIRDLRSVAQTEPAGAGYQYSNLNYNILGAIVQQASGQTYGEYMEEQIFRSLGMNGSFSSPERAQAAMAETSDLRPPSGYQSLFGLPVPTRQGEHSGTVPSGYLVSTAEDMSKYLLMQMDNGSLNGTRLLGGDGIAKMREPAAAIGDGSFYGMGWQTTGDYIWHNGMTENTYSEMRIRGDHGIFILANSADPLIISYGGILPGIDDILTGRSPSLESLPNYNKLYGIADGAAIIAILLFLASVRSLFRWKKAFRPAPWKTVMNLVLLAACNVALPLAILHFVSGIAPWEVVATWAPGIGWGLIALPWLLFFTGALKALLMIAAAISHRSDKRRAARAEKLSPAADEASGSGERPSLDGMEFGA